MVASGGVHNISGSCHQYKKRAVLDNVNRLGQPPNIVFWTWKKEFRTTQGIASKRNLSGCDIRPAPFKPVIHLYQNHKNKRRNQAGKEYAAVPDVFHSM